MALLIFMRSGLTFSVVSATGSPTRSASMSAMSRSSPGLVSVFGLRPRLAPAVSAVCALGGRPGFFFTISSAGVTALAGFFSSSALAVAFSDLAAGDFVRDTGLTFVSGFPADRAGGLGWVLTTLSCTLAGITGLIDFLAMGFAAGFTSFPDF